MMNSKHSQSGFTLIELCFVLLIFGMVMASVMTGFSLYNKNQVLVKNEESLDNSRSALTEYVARFGVYPCPADPALGPADVNYGRERRALPVTDPNYDRAACTFPIVVVQGEDTADLGLARDNVLIGAVPFRTIMDRLMANGGAMESDFAEFDSVDAWGRKLTYAVTQTLTNAQTYNSFLGAIDVVDENDLSLMDANEDVNLNGILDTGEDANNNGFLDAGRYAHFVLVSHGENGRGARMRDGTAVQGCVLGVPVSIPPPPGASQVTETENCDGTDGKFINGLRNEREDSYYDDKMRYGIFQNSNLWRFADMGEITNVNPGRVGVGIFQPQEMFHALNDIMAFRARARLFTDRTGANALDPDAIAGTATTAASTQMQCPAGQVVTQIQQGRVTCGTPFGAGAPPNMQCGLSPLSGLQMVMFGVRGNAGNPQLMCCDPTAASGIYKCP